MKHLVRIALTVTLAVAAASPARAAGDPATAEVTAVALRSAAGRADFSVAVKGDVTVNHFALSGPDRLVLDLAGARLAGRTLAYDGIVRNGIRNVRTSQYKADVVRIVLDLDQARQYTVERSGGEILVSFKAEQPFLAWSSAAPVRPALAAAAPAVALDDDADAFVDEPVEQLQARAVPVSATRRPEVAVPLDKSPLYTAAQGEPRITVTWDRASIADVISGFAAFSGRTIIIGKDVKGEVTAEIKNQPWPQAFQAILATQGLSAQEMPGGIIRVDAPSALATLDSLEPLETAVVRINYARADSLVKTVETIVTKNRGRVIADNATNSLIITDTRSRVGSVTDFVKGLDIRTPQVSIAAKIIFVDRSDLEQLGLRYDLGDRGTYFNGLVNRGLPLSTGGNSSSQADQAGYRVSLGGNSLASVANASAQVVGPALDLIFSTALGGFTVTTFLQALERTELSDVQAEPVITTLDNRKADILVGEETPLRVIDASGAQGAQPGQAPRATVQFRETGIRLTVTPHVTNNRQILLDLLTERSAIQPLAASDLGFNFQKQKAETRLLVADGETAVTGGLTVTTVSKIRSGIPLLSSLPIVGKLFSYSEDRESRRDLIILVTPRIIDDGQPLN